MIPHRSIDGNQRDEPMHHLLTWIFHTPGTLHSEDPAIAEKLESGCAANQNSSTYT